MVEDALQRQLRFSGAINRLGEVTLSTDEPATLLDALTHIAGTTLGADRAVVYDVRIDEGNAVRLAEWAGPKLTLPPASGVYPLHFFGDGALEVLWRKRNWLESHAAAQNPVLVPEALALIHEQLKIGSLLWFPFFFREQGFRLLIFNQVEPRRWMEDELNFVSAVAKQISLALEKLRLLEDLAASEARYRALYDDSPALFFTVNPERKILSVNTFVIKHLGYSEEELLGNDVLNVFVPEDREAIEKQLASCFATPGEIFRFDGRKQLKGGGVVFVRENVRAGIGVSGKLEALIVCEDVTDEKRIEHAMLQTQKLETLGVLVGGISHDFNNLLGAIVGNAELGLIRLPMDSPAREPFELAARAALRAGELVKQLLAYSARAPFSRQRVSINEVVRELAELLVVTVGKRVKVQLELDPKSPMVVTDPTQLRQVLMNLVHNAADAMEGREGQVIVRTSVASLEARNRAVLPPGRYARIEVVDVGVGIERDQLERIFDPFFTTKASGRGLGLSAVRSIAQRHGGQVLVESQPGKGSTFTVLLPEASVETVQPQPVRETELPELPKGATVLVVDDDPGVLRVLSDIIREFGLVPLSASGAEAGRQLFRTHPEIVCVLMDLSMPEGGGVPLVKEFHALRPSSPILLISGFAEPEITASMSGELSGFLAKPFTPKELKAALVRAVRPNQVVAH